MESAAARVCREAGARVTTNVMVRDLDLAVMNVQDARRLEVIADGSHLHGGAQLEVETTIVSAALRRHSPARGRRWGSSSRSQTKEGANLPELVAPCSRCRLVVLANEVGGRQSTEALGVLEASRPGQGQERATSHANESACASARAVAVSLLGLRSQSGADGVTTHLHEVEGEFRSVL